MTELIFANNPKVNGKVLLGFCRGYQRDAYFWVGIQKHVSTAALYFEFAHKPKISLIITNDKLQEII